MTRLVVCLALLLAVAPLARAQSPAPCPWLTLGTVSHLLGEPAVVRVQLADDGTGSCRFQPQTTANSTSVPSLILTVTAHPVAACDSNATPLRGIGNHAEECVLAASTDHDSASAITRMAVTRILGQVRTRWFALDATGLPQASLRNPPPRWPDEAARPTQLELAAEQIADNLY